MGPTGSGGAELWIDVGGVLRPDAGYTGIRVGTLEVTGTSLLTGDITSVGILGIGNGTAAAPSLALTNSLTTGLFRGGADQLGVSVAGALLLAFTANGIVFGASGDLALARLAAASLRIGLAPSATPVAQALTVGEASRSGTDSDVGGASGTIRSGLGTGTGTASQLLLQTPTLAVSGTGAQTYTTRVTVDTALVTVAPKLLCSGEVEIDGALNHDGTTVGFYTSTPITQAAGIASPVGGAVIDIQARAAVAALLVAMRPGVGVGLIGP